MLEVLQQLDPKKILTSDVEEEQSPHPRLQTGSRLNLISTTWMTLKPQILDFVGTLCCLIIKRLLPE
jgi:hypothetical protein